MNNNSCAKCNENFDFVERTPTLLTCGHRICRVCISGFEGEYPCPVDGLTSSVNRSKSSLLRTEGSRKQLYGKSDDGISSRGTLNKDATSDPAKTSLKTSRDPFITTAETFGPNGAIRKINPEDLFADQGFEPDNTKGSRGTENFDSVKNLRSGEFNIKLRAPERCELHPEHFLDIICKHPKCQKYVCLECVAFGNHSVV